MNPITSLSNPFIGRAFDAGSTSLHHSRYLGDVAEIIIYDVALDGADRDSRRGLSQAALEHGSLNLRAGVCSNAVPGDASACLRACRNGERRHSRSRPGPACRAGSSHSSTPSRTNAIATA